MAQHLDPVLTYAGLVALASSSVYAGSIGSYKAPKKPKGKSKSKEEDESSDEEEELSEHLSTSEALLFPIIGSFVLGGFYLAFKYFGEDWINKMMGYYFFVMGIGCLWSCLVSLTKQIVGRRWYKSTPRYRLKLSKTSKPLLRFRLPTPVLLLPSAAASILFFLTEPKPAVLTNILSLSFAHTAMTTMKLDSLQTGCLLLSGLFFYDVWWVFGTDVMVKVATTLTIPIKLLWPRSIFKFLSDPTGPTPTMLLGLGDVVLPGTLVALAYRLDQHLAFERKPRGTYFRAVLIGYMVGLSMAFGAMHVFKAAQPALLYLSPSCCLSFIFTAVSRGELGYVWTWNEGEEDRDGDKSKKE